MLFINSIHKLAREGKGMKRIATSFWAISLTGNVAQAAGFALVEQNASGLGNAYAGQAATAADASTLYFNPAGMTHLDGRQMVLAGNAIRPSAEFSNRGSGNAPLQSSLGGDGGDAGAWALVPNFYYVTELRPGVKVGLGVNAPFGLATVYDTDWVGRFHAVKSDMKTLNVNPSLAFKVSDRFSVGVGFNMQRIQAVLTNKVNYSAVFAQASGGALIAPDIEGTAKVEGDDWSWGFNLGMLFSPDEATRLGIHYRSPVDFTLEGNASFRRPAGLSATQQGILNAAVPNGNVTAQVQLPDTWSLSLFRQLSPSWDVLADLTWTHWSLFQDLTVVRTSGAVLSTTPERWDDSWRYSLGLNFRPGGHILWRAGIAYDETPVSDNYRTPRIPDQSRTWLALGARIRMSEQASIDIGYAHVFVADANIHHASASGGALAGNYDNAVDIVGVQYTHPF